MTYALELLPRVVKVVKMLTEVTTVDCATMAKINFSQKCHSSFHGEAVWCYLTKGTPICFQGYIKIFNGPPLFVVSQ